MLWHCTDAGRPVSSQLGAFPFGNASVFSGSILYPLGPTVEAMAEPPPHTPPRGYASSAHALGARRSESAGT